EVREQQVEHREAGGGGEVREEPQDDPRQHEQGGTPGQAHRRLTDLPGPAGRDGRSGAGQVRHAAAPDGKSPWGRNESVKIRITKVTSGAIEGPAATVANAATTPMTTPATSEPRVLPRPPRITTGKTMANHSIASPGTSAWFIATSTPATAEKAPARPA